jgi:hypothetical protein
MWFRYLMIGFWSFAAIQIFAFQAFHIFKAFSDYFNKH